MKHVAQINRIKPKFLHGYPSTMYLLASLMEEKGLRLNCSVTGVLCGSEKLFDYQRIKIGGIFNCRVFGWYGHSEYQVLAGECEFSERLHVYPQYGYTELIPNGCKDENGKELYEIVATGFNNYFMPLIRYRTEDYAIVSDEQKCKCGRNYLLLDEVIGREQEFLVDKDENLISVTALIYGQHYSAFEAVRQFQIIQEKPGEIDILFVPKNRESIHAITGMVRQIKELLGDRIDVQHRIVNKIDVTPLGKRKTVVQALDISQFIETER